MKYEIFKILYNTRLSIEEGKQTFLIWLMTHQVYHFQAILFAYLVTLTSIYMSFQQKEKFKKIILEPGHLGPGG